MARSRTAACCSPDAAPCRACIWTPTRLAFGDLPPGQQANAAVQLANFQAVPVEVHTISPQDGAFFELVGGAGNCPPVPFVLLPGESCQLEYLATSSGTQAQRARVLIHSR